jgi:antitoxin (DNA-binding transcriptional repressor) of toxin-antitoxin stability system
MESVGIRELKDRLRHYLRAVRQRESVVVTVPGEPVARLCRSPQWVKAALRPELEEQMWELAAEGFLTWNGGPFQMPEPAVVNRGLELLSDLLVEDRE